MLLTVTRRRRSSFCVFAGTFFVLLGVVAVGGRLLCLVGAVQKP